MTIRKSLLVASIATLLGGVGALAWTTAPAFWRGDAGAENLAFMLAIAILIVGTRLLVGIIREE